MLLNLFYVTTDITANQSLSYLSFHQIERTKRWFLYFLSVRLLDINKEEHIDRSAKLGCKHKEGYAYTYVPFGILVSVVYKMDTIL